MHAFILAGNKTGESNSYCFAKIEINKIHTMKRVAVLLGLLFLILCNESLVYSQIVFNTTLKHFQPASKSKSGMTGIVNSLLQQPFVQVSVQYSE